MNLFKKLFFVACIGVFLGCINTTVVHADTEKNDQVTIDDVHKADEYVSVKGNRFVFDEQKAREKLSSEDVKVINDQIARVNQQIASNSMKIDTESKEIYTPVKYFSFAVHNSNYTTKKFWWGKRYYFTSNEAVKRGAAHFRKIANDRGNDSIFWSAVGDAVAYISPWYTLAANLASLGVQGVANRFNRAASDLVAYNNKHRKNRIYLDFNFSCQYSLHILK